MSLKPKKRLGQAGGGGTREEGALPWSHGQKPKKGWGGGGGTSPLLPSLGSNSSVPSIG